MIDFINKIKENCLEIIPKYNKILVNVEKVNEYGIDIVRVIIDDPQTFDIDIDDVAAINQELLDLVNDLLPDGYYLEVTSVGVERPLITNEDFEKAIGKYIYISCYEKIVDASNQKEIYGYLEGFDEESITVNAVIKSRTKITKIQKTKIAKIRLAVKF